MFIARQLVVDCEIFTNFILCLSYDNHKMFRKLDVRPKLVVTLAVKKVNFSHTRYRALGPELIPVYRQSARR